MTSEKTESRKLKPVRILLILIRSILDCITNTIFSLIYRNAHQVKFDKVKEPYMLESAISLAAKIRSKKVTSESVVKSFIDRIKEVNHILNAVVDERFDEALKEAKDVDKFLASTSLSVEELQKDKPFLGVPFTSKESTSAKGMAFTFGMVSRKGSIASEDAVIVQRVKDSGAILVAVTNVPELNLWCETRNNIYGQTLNPYDLTRTVGGSSGGESCILTVAGSPMGIGTDIGGSTRMPAYYCGIYGHKPTTGLTPIKGIAFRTGKEGNSMVTAGTMTRHAEDIIPFLKVLVADKLDMLKLDTKVNLKDLKIYYVLEPGNVRVSRVNSEIRSAIQKAADHLSTVTSCPAQKLYLRGFRYALSLWRHGMAKEPANFAFDLGNRNEEVSLLRELPKLVVGKTQHTLPAIMRLIDLKVLPPTDAEWAERETDRLTKELLEALGDNGVLLFPSCPTDAPYHYASILKPYNFAYWAIFNLLKLPVTQVPMGLSKNGLPIGFQVVAAPYNDHLTIAVAKELENTFGGWVPPFMTN